MTNLLDAIFRSRRTLAELEARIAKLERDVAALRRCNRHSVA